MPFPPEVAFDRYLRTYTPYTGKQDLERLSQRDLRSLLATIQRGFIEALLNEKQDVAAHVPHFPIHFDYIASDTSNARAFVDEDYSYSYIGVTMGLVYQLGDVSVQVSGSEPVTNLLDIKQTSGVRDGLHALLFQTLWTFVAAHEYVHIVHGHVKRQGASSLTFNEIEDQGEIGSIEQQTMELDADGYGGVYHVLSNFFREEVCANGVQALQIGDRDPQAQDQILFCCFVVAVGGFLFARPPVDVNKANVYNLTHPPQLVRLNYVMEGALGWCRQNRPALATWMTPSLFRMLIRPVAETIWGLDGGLRWQDQIAFLESDPGKEYVSRIGERLKTYVAAL